MKRTSFSRREMLGLWVGTVIAFAAPGRTDAATGGVPANAALRRMAQLLFPHPSLDESVYQDVLETLQAAALDDPVLAAALTQGRAELDRAAGGAWLDSGVDVQLSVMAQIEDSAFFRIILEATRKELYLHPEVWLMLGFEGSSVAHGGYIDRGFDDIDWLPKDAT